MPPRVYTVTHRNSVLRDDEKRQLIEGLAATFGFTEEGEDDD